MKRREFLKTLAFGIMGMGIAPDVLAENTRPASPSPQADLDDHIKDYLQKMEHFNEPHHDDILVPESDSRVFISTVNRLRRLEETAGHGNFQILSFDAGLGIARKYSEVGEFTAEETAFIEKVFYSDASSYGFFGKKPLENLTDSVRENNVVKVPYTGNYLFYGQALETYEKIKKQVGEQVILTSGVRGVMKQFLLFLNKAYECGGNFSLASRSLAPPGYSFHGKGDFDVGQAGFGAANFTESFTSSEVYHILSDLGYLKLRYPRQNLLGVRYEPWHIKLDS